MPFLVSKPPGTFFLCLTFLGGLASCASHHAERPTSWKTATTSVTQGCVDISGSYQNLGEDAPGNKDKTFHERHPQYLSRFFTPLLDNGKPHEWLTHVTISGVHDGTLEIALKRKDETVQRVTLKRDRDFACTAKGIEIKETSSLHYNIASLGDIRTNILVFGKGHDGALLVEDIEKEKGVAVIILAPLPYATSTVQYYRFPPAVSP